MHFCRRICVQFATLLPPKELPIGNEYKKWTAQWNKSAVSKFDGPVHQMIACDVFMFAPLLMKRWEKQGDKQLSSVAKSALVKIDEEKLSSPVRIPGLYDGDGVNEHVFIRGGANNHGDLVERRYLEALGGFDSPVKNF